MSLNYTTATDEQKTDNKCNGHLTAEVILEVLKSHYRLKPYEIPEVRIEGMSWDRDVVYVGPGNRFIRRSAIIGLLKELNSNGK